MSILNDKVHVYAGSLRAISNPLDGVLPDFTIFGAKFTELWQKILGGIWGIGIVISVVFIIMGLVSMAKAGGNPQTYKEGHKQFVVALIALGGLAALAVLVGAILALVG